MPKYLVQLTHGDDHVACVRALEAIEHYGTHLITHANWGCRDGVHCGWMIDEFADRNEAMQVVPPQFRDEARIVEVECFSKEYLAALVAELGDRP